MTTSPLETFLDWWRLAPLSLARWVEYGLDPTDRVWLDRMPLRARWRRTMVWGAKSALVVMQEYARRERENDR